MDFAMTVKKEKQLSITLERCNSDILFAIHDNGLGMDPVNVNVYSPEKMKGLV